jgi:hypothetical protein
LSAIDDDDEVASAGRRSDTGMLAIPCPPGLGDRSSARSDDPQAASPHYVDGVVGILAMVPVCTETSAKGDFRRMSWARGLAANDA